MPVDSPRRSGGPSACGPFGIRSEAREGIMPDGKSWERSTEATHTLTQ